MEEPGAAAAAATPKSAGAPPSRRAAAGPVSTAPAQNTAQREEAEKAALEEEDAETVYDVIRHLLGKYYSWFEVKERTWRIGRIYACLAICDTLARVTALRLFQVQYGMLRTASVSDTQTLDYTPYGRPSDIENSALIRLTITGSAGFIRSIVSSFLLWKAFPHLRPSWDGQPSKKRRLKSPAEGTFRPNMRIFTYLFRILLLLWCLFDIIQVCVPEDADSERFTHHRIFKLVTESAFFLVHMILLKTLRHEREALLPFVYAGYFVMAMIVFTGLWLDFRISYKPWTYIKVMWASVQWTFLAEMESLMIFVGIAMPDNLTLSMGFHVGRTGQALPWEDDSFLNRAELPKPAPETTAPLLPTTPAPAAQPGAPAAQPAAPAAAAGPDTSAPQSDAESDGSGRR
mmetsp:Transcript_127882/g.235292  ORF Transcript_127882/g.235292 Transcript_127882/m.235292 type:complete len:402 (-) Transcript_127882:82-1287(-)